MNDKTAVIAIGSNLAGAGGRPPHVLCVDAARALSESPSISVMAISYWYQSSPIPPSDQPLYTNGAVKVSTSLSPAHLLLFLQSVEARFGRTRGEANAARTLDLDILTIEGVVCRDAALEVPHPRLHERAFALLPLRDVAPGWRHPLLGLTVDEMIATLPEQGIKRLT